MPPPRPHLFPSDSQTSPESVQSGQESGLHAPGQQVAGQASGCQVLQMPWALPGADSRVSVKMGRGTSVGSPEKG